MKNSNAKRDWIVLRALALLAIPLTVWFVNSVVGLTGASYDEFTGWLSKPLNAGLMIVMVVVTFWHAALGCHEIIEDYVHNEKVKNLSLRAKAIAFFVVAVFCVGSVLKVALT